MMNATQCRAARAILGISNSDLAKAAGVGVNTVSRFERGRDTRASSIEAMQNHLETAGAVFIANDAPSLSGGAGVRMRGGQ